VCRVDSRRCILDDDAPSGRDAQPVGREQENLWIGLPALHVLGGHDRLEACSPVDDRENRVDVRARRCRCDRLAPALRVKPLQPALDARQERDPAFPHESPVALLLGGADAVDLGEWDGAAEMAPQDGVVALAERREEAVVRQLDSLDSEGRAPGEPVVVGRVEQRAVHVPEDGARGGSG